MTELKAILSSTDFWMTFGFPLIIALGFIVYSKGKDLKQILTALIDSIIDGILDR